MGARVDSEPERTEWGKETGRTEPRCLPITNALELLTVALGFVCIARDHEVEPVTDARWLQLHFKIGCHTTQATYNL